MSDKDRSYEGAMARIEALGSRGRFPVGEDVTSAALKNDEVRAIRRAYAENRITVREAAEEFGVCRNTIYNLLKRKTYADVED